MSSKSSQGRPVKNYFSKKMVVASIVMIVVFLGIVMAYPTLFSPSKIGPATGPVPGTGHDSGRDSVATPATSSAPAHE